MARDVYLHGTGRVWSSSLARGHEMNDVLVPNGHARTTGAGDCSLQGLLELQVLASRNSRQRIAWPHIRMGQRWWMCWPAASWAGSCQSLTPKSCQGIDARLHHIDGFMNGMRFKRIYPEATQGFVMCSKTHCNWVQKIQMQISRPDKLCVLPTAKAGLSSDNAADQGKGQLSLQQSSAGISWHHTDGWTG